MIEIRIELTRRGLDVLLAVLVVIELLLIAGLIALLTLA